MKIKTLYCTQKHFKLAAMTIGAVLLLGFAWGCAKAEKEKEPEVSVQTTPAEKEDISQIVNEEAVIFPLQQATVAPKITSTIKQFLKYAVTAGQKFAPALEFAPLPQSVAAKDKAIVKGL